MSSLTHNAILFSRGREYYWEGSNALSIKLFFAGQSFYNVGRGHYIVDENSYLVLNQDQFYSISIESPTLVESFCLFFMPGFAEETYRTMITRNELLLDEPFHKPDTPIHFFERIYPRDKRLFPAIARLRTAVHQGYHDPLWQEEQLHNIMQCLLYIHQDIRAEVAALPATRAATREEIYRRLYLARDYAIAHLDQPLTLNEMAGTACLSTTHFLRTFKQVFRQTPHQFLTCNRLERAQTLLRQTTRSVTDICLAVGFSSLSSFSWLFHQRTGYSPAMYRKMHGEIKMHIKH